MRNRRRGGSFTSGMRGSTTCHVCRPHSGLATVTYSFHYLGCIQEGVGGRRVLAPDTDNSINIVRMVGYWNIFMRELIMDNGSAFGAHRRNGEGEWNSSKDTLSWR